MGGTNVSKVQKILNHSRVKLYVITVPEMKPEEDLSCSHFAIEEENLIDRRSVAGAGAFAIFVTAVEI
jgi:hypothetical protein